MEHGKYGVRLDCGDWDSAFESDLQLIAPTAPDQAAPTHIVIEGVRYALTPEPEARTPARGEVWEVLGELVLVTDDRNVRLHNGHMGEYDYERIKDFGTFVAASLAEGIRDGSITAYKLK